MTHQPFREQVDSIETPKGPIALIDRYKMYGLDYLLTFLAEAEFDKPVYDRTYLAVGIVRKIQWSAYGYSGLFNAVNGQRSNTWSSYVCQSNVSDSIRIFSHFEAICSLPAIF